MRNCLLSILLGKFLLITYIEPPLAYDKVRKLKRRTEDRYDSLHIACASEALMTGPRMPLATLTYWATR